MQLLYHPEKTGHKTKIPWHHVLMTSAVIVYSVLRPLQVNSIALKACGRAVHYSLFITRGYEHDTKNERSSSATEMMIEDGTDSE